MTDDLIKRLHTFGNEGFPIAHESADALEAQAKRIAKLEETRNRLTDDVSTERNELRIWRDRAEKAEDDLAAVRAALVRWTATAVPGCSDWEIIAAARGEQPSPEKSCKTCARLIREEGACGLYGVSLCSGFDKWQPKSDVCPTCHGTRRITDDSGDDWNYCPDCTGKKETK